MNILYDANVNTNPSDWYSTIVISNIRNEDGSPVNAESFISFYFIAPITADPEIQINTSPWASFICEVKNQPIDDKSCSVIVTIKPNPGRAFSLSEKDYITIPFQAYTIETAHLLKTLPPCCSTIIITADSLPVTEGIINLHCAASPDIEKLNNAKPAVKLTFGKIIHTAELDMGKEQQVSLLCGKYEIQTEELENEDATIVVSVLANPSIVEVIAGEISEVNITFGKANYFSAVDFSFEEIEEIANEKMRVSLRAANQSYSVDVTSNEITNISYIDPEGCLSTLVTPLRLNNKEISFNVPALKLEARRIEHVIKREMMKVTDVDTHTFRPLTLTINTESEISKNITVRLLSDEMNYVQHFEVKNQTIMLPLTLIPGLYNVVVENFIDNKVVHVVNAPKTINVGSVAEAVLNIDIKRSANLSVPGFPDFLSFGGCTTFESNNKDLFINARTSSIFKYAGTGGDGNPGEFLARDDATVNSINLARGIERALPADGNVLPVMISYTVQFSGGGVSGLGNRDAHMHCYGNFILALSIAEQHKDAEHPVPAGFIVNPDFLGECQKNNITANTPMPVRSPLSDALKHWNIHQTIPESIEDNVEGYIQSVNWLVRTIAPSVTFGWQINLWGVNGSIWIYDNKGALTPQQAAKQTADYLKSLKVYGGVYTPDFLAIDRYEADDFTVRSYANSYCYGPQEWRRFYEFCAEVSAELAQPVMPWQIPASRTPLQNDRVTENFDDQHWGTSANYLFGDSVLGNDVKNIHPTIRSFDFTQHAPATAAQVGPTPEIMYARKGKFDVSVPAYNDFAKQGIFAVLLGGGSTLGIVPPLACKSADTLWAGNKLHAYRDLPISFVDTLK